MLNYEPIIYMVLLLFYGTFNIKYCMNCVHNVH